VDNSQSMSPSARRCDSPFSGEEHDMKIEEHMDLEKAKVSVPSVAEEKAEPKTSKEMPKQPTQGHSAVGPASTGSFFRRKMAEMKAKEEDELTAKAHQEHADPPPIVETPPPKTLVDSSTLPQASEQRLGMGERDEPRIDMGELEDCGIDMGELIPNLENFDPAILDFLPSNVR
jgi:hypothetical protein